MTTELHPDASGTVVVSGSEELAISFDLKATFVKTLTAELDEMKHRLRASAEDVLNRAGEGAKRVFFRNGNRGGVGVTRPDYTARGNRLVLSDKKMTEVSKIGSIEELVGGDIYEDEISDPGGEVIELRGMWVQWWKQHMPQYLEGTTQDLKYENRPRTMSRRLKASVLPKLREMAVGGNEVAKALLAAGIKSLSVLTER